MEPYAVQFFGECMTSPKNGRTPLATDIYVSYKVIKYNYYTQIQDCLNTVLWTYEMEDSM
jgi:hypothetical protein